MAVSKIILNGTTQIDLTTDTVTNSAHIMNGYVGHLADGTQTTGTGQSGPSATAHTIYFEFSDGTDTTITGYWDNSFISDVITATTPSTYGQKTVDSASLDSVEWYAKPTETWETIYESNDEWFENDTPYGYFWITDLGSVPIAVGSVWRITINSTISAVATAVQTSNGIRIGNPKYFSETDDGSDIPFAFGQSAWAWSGSCDLPGNARYPLKIERQVTA